MKKLINITISCAVFCLTTFSLKTQVTIGTDEQPVTGAVLDLKNLTETDGDANANKGLKFPRVELTNLNSLTPLLTTAQETPVEQRKHKGTVVYNVGTTFSQGLYVWDSEKWIKVGEDTGETADVWELGGNTGTDPENNYIGTSDAQALSIRTNATDRMRITADGNVGIGTTSPSSRLHVDGQTIITSPSTIGMNAAPLLGSLLDLKQNEASGANTTSQKGLLLPRVALQDAQSLQPLVPAASDIDATKTLHTGIFVYNIAETGNFKKGIYSWDGTQWVGTVSELPQQSSVRMLNLRQNTTTTSGNWNGSGGVELFFGEAGTNITIPETGSYAFSFRFYGSFPGLGDPEPSPNRATFYLSIRDGNDNIRDFAELSMYVGEAGSEGGSNKNYTYSITLAGDYTAGEIVKVKMAHPEGVFSYRRFLAWELKTGTMNADRTSLVWWKLE